MNTLSQKPPLDGQLIVVTHNDEKYIGKFKSIRDKSDKKLHRTYYYLTRLDDGYIYKITNDPGIGVTRDDIHDIHLNDVTTWKPLVGDHLSAVRLSESRGLNQEVIELEKLLQRGDIVLIQVNGHTEISGRTHTGNEYEMSRLSTGNLMISDAVKTLLENRRLMNTVSKGDLFPSNVANLMNRFGGTRRRKIRRRTRKNK